MSRKEQEIELDHLVEEKNGVITGGNLKFNKTHTGGSDIAFSELELQKASSDVLFCDNKHTLSSNIELEIQTGCSIMNSNEVCLPLENEVCLPSEFSTTKMYSKYELEIQKGCSDVNTSQAVVRMENLSQVCLPLGNVGEVCLPELEFRMGSSGRKLVSKSLPSHESRRNEVNSVVSEVGNYLPCHVSGRSEDSSLTNKEAKYLPCHGSERKRRHDDDQEEEKNDKEEYRREYKFKFLRKESRRKFEEKLEDENDGISTVVEIVEAKTNIAGEKIIMNETLEDLDEVSTSRNFSDIRNYFKGQRGEVCKATRNSSFHRDFKKAPSTRKSKNKGIIKLEPKFKTKGHIEHYFGPIIKGNRTRDPPSELLKIHSEQEETKESDL